MERKENLNLSPRKTPGLKQESDSMAVTSRRLYTPPQIICLTDSNIETGTETNLKETSFGVWKSGS